MIDEKRIQQVLDRFIDSGAETGAAAVVTVGGEEAARCSSGFADVENGKEFTPDTICRAFSCSKVVTGVAAMQLLERGLIELDNPVEWYIPEFAGAGYIRNGERIAASRAVTLRDLLNMTSGVPYPGGGEGIEPTNNLWGELDEGYRKGAQLTTMQFAARAGGNPLMFDAGDNWMYGASADVFGAVVEVVSGMRYGDYLRGNIFAPLGMNDTAFYVPKDKLDRLAVFYEGAGEGRHKLGWVNLCIYDYTEDPAFQSGGAGIFSTAADYSKLGAALSNGAYNGVSILGRKTIDFMRQNALTAEQRRGFDWAACRGCGYGNFVRTLEDRNAASLLASEGSFGWDGWSGTYILNDPDEKVSVTLFVQRAGAGTTSLAKAVVNAVYSML